MIVSHKGTVAFERLERAGSLQPASRPAPAAADDIAPEDRAPRAEDAAHDGLTLSTAPTVSAPAPKRELEDEAASSVSTPKKAKTQARLDWVLPFWSDYWARKMGGELWIPPPNQ